MHPRSHFFYHCIITKYNLFVSQITFVHCYSNNLLICMKCSIILKCDFTLACACVSFSSLSSARANCLLYISEPPSPQAFAAIIWFHSMGFAGKMALLGTAEMTLPAGNLSRASSFCI